MELCDLHNVNIVPDRDSNLAHLHTIQAQQYKYLQCNYLGVHQIGHVPTQIQTQTHHTIQVNEKGADGLRHQIL